MSPECKALPTVSRVASAAGAMAITSALLLAVGLGFSPGASAQGASRQVASAPAAKAGTVAIAAAAVAVPAQADAASVARGRYSFRVISSWEPPRRRVRTINKGTSNETGSLT